MEVTIFVITSLSAFIVNLSMAIFVYLKNKREVRNKLFSLLCLTIGVWCLYPTIMTSKLTLPAMLWLSRIIYLFAAFTPTLYLHFVLEMVGNIKGKELILFLAYMFSFVFAFLCFSNLFITGISHSNTYTYGIVPGPLYTIFVGIFAFISIFGFYLLLNKYRIWSGFKKNQCKYLFISCFLAYTGGVMHFLNVYGMKERFPHDIFLIIFVSITAYTIVKYRLMDIRIVFRTVITYSVMTAFVTFFFILAIYLPSLFLGSINKVDSFLLIVMIALGFVLVFNPLRKKIENIFVNLFYPQRESHYRELSKYSRELSTILDIEVLLNFIVEKTIQTLAPSFGYLYVFNEHLSIYECKVALPRGSNPRKNFNEKSPLVKTLIERKDVLLEEDLAIFPPGIREKLQDIFNELQAKLVLPLIFRDEMVGFLCLGGKLSGDIYTNMDIQLLSLFSNEASIALENARLFQQIKNMKDYNEGILQGMRSGVISLDAEGKISAFNLQAEKITRLPRGYVIGRDYSILPSPLNEVFKIVYSKKINYTDQELYIEVNKDKNKKIPVMINTTLFYEDVDGAGGADEKIIKQVICVLTDLTKLKELEGEVRRAEKMATMGRIAGELAHEIKNPLVSIRTLAQLLPSKYQDEEFRGKFMSLALREVDRIDQMINKLLNLTARKEKIEYTRVNLQDLLEEIFEDVSIQINARHIKIIKNYTSEPAILADRGELKKAFSNIITNCIEAIGEEGQIYIDIKKKKDTPSFYVITFKDTGPGFSEESIERAFDAFYTTKQKGSGLGLFVTYRVIRNHEGKVRVNNWEKGGRVTVELPSCNEISSGSETVPVVGDKYPPDKSRAKKQIKKQAG